VAIFAEKFPVYPIEMRNMVASSGGTSVDAIYQLDKGGFRTVLSKAVLASPPPSLRQKTIRKSIAGDG